MANLLKNETSPYLLQHAQNPVHWFPWGEKAFQKAKEENKPVFLSIGYSTCHWCHVMAHESFESKEIADILNDKFVAIKVDKEERPDIDSIYMDACQALTGSGGWPLSVFLTPEQKPFYAGTYFPKEPRQGMPGFGQLLSLIAEQWKNNRVRLLESADSVAEYLNKEEKVSGQRDPSVFEKAFYAYQQSFDEQYGGFGSAPKFPSPQNYLFLLEYYRVYQEESALKMVKKSLLQMYKGGLFDHIGFGFSRYSTDRWFLVPHFEKMLYDNGLLMLTYGKAYAETKEPVFLEIAEKTADYILREMTSLEGGFYAAQDADSEGVEGRYYTFDASEIEKVLGTEAAKEFQRCYGISKEGNFEGKNIPNLLHQKQIKTMDQYLPQIYEYRKKRYSLHLDDKILTAWNSLTIAAFAFLYQVSEKEKYLEAAKKAQRFIENHLWDGERLHVSWRDGKASGTAFLDDYAWYIYGLLGLYEAALEKSYLNKAVRFFKKVTEEYFDQENGGYYLIGKENEELILKPKDVYDGAMPCGNSVMAYNLVKLAQLAEDDIEEVKEKQLKFLSNYVEKSYMGTAFSLLALFMDEEPRETITVVFGDAEAEDIRDEIPIGANVRMKEQPTKEYPLLNNRTTYYVCQGHRCLPPANKLAPLKL